MSPSGDDTVAPISPATAKDMLDAGAAVIVDVREPAELVASGKVPGALEIPRGAIAVRAGPDSGDRDPALDPEKAVILYCGGGKRAEAAGLALKELGYRKVYNLGGLKDWVGAGYPVER